MNYFWLCASRVPFWISQKRQFALCFKSRIFSCVLHNGVCSLQKMSFSSVPCVPDNQVAPARELSSKLGVELDIILNSFKVSPDLLKITFLRWESCFRVLTSHGLSVEDSLKMVTKCPHLLQMDENILSKVFQQWRGALLDEKYVFSLLKSQPQFLQLSEKQISVRIAQLKSLGTTKGIVDLLKGAPRTMFDNWDDVLAKISFLVNEMRIEKKHVLKSFALNRSLLFLKTRFVFLERCGKYIKPKLDADPNVFNKNPPLKSIVETNEEHFATIIAGLSLEEYEVFEELYSLEMEELELNWSDSDIDSE